MEGSDSPEPVPLPPPAAGWVVGGSSTVAQAELTPAIDKAPATRVAIVHDRFVLLLCIMVNISLALRDPFGDHLTWEQFPVFFPAATGLCGVISAAGSR
jgi:hypothetical protein